MTREGLELTFTTTTKDWARVQALLNRWAVRRESPLVYILTHKGTAGVVHAVVAVVCLFILIRFGSRLLARDLSDMLDPMTILMVVLVGWALWPLGRGLWQLAAKAFASGKPSRTGREGVHWGPHHLLATADSLIVRLSARRSVYRWNAFTDLKTTKDLLLLQLTPRSAVAIPRHAFRSKADEATFCDFVQRRTGS